MAVTSRVYCYFCATKLEQKGPHAYWCPSCEYTQYESPKPATEIILRQNKRILISERGQEPDKGTFDMPGGFVEAGETVEEAALREAEEELGIAASDISNMQYFTSFHTYYPYGKEVYNVLVVVFVADLKAGIEVAALDDVSSVRWITESDIETVPWSREHQKKNAQRLFAES